jgi:hypothetical protein
LTAFVNLSSRFPANFALPPLHAISCFYLYSLSLKLIVAERNLVVIATSTSTVKLGRDGL